MNQLGDYRHRLSLLQQWRCTQTVRGISLLLLSLAACLLLLMFGFAFMNKTDVITCRTVPVTATTLQSHVPLSAILNSNWLASPNDTFFFPPSPIHLTWPPRRLLDLQCQLWNQSHWKCDEHFQPATRLLLERLLSIPGNQTSSPKMEILLNSEKFQSLQSSSETSKAPLMSDGSWMESLFVPKEFLFFHLNQVRRNSLHFSSRLSCTYSYQRLDQLFDCYPPGACEYKLFALRHLAVFQMGLAWFAYGSLGTRPEVQIEARRIQLRRDKHLLHTLRHAQAMLLMLNGFCFLVHGLVPLATPLVYIAVHFFQIALHSARMFSVGLIALQYLVFTLCGMVLRSI